MATLRVVSRKPVIVAGWKPGQVFALRGGDRIAVNSTGIASYRGVLLNLPMSVREKLVVAQRVVVED